MTISSAVPAEIAERMQDEREERLERICRLRRTAADEPLSECCMVPKRDDGPDDTGICPACGDWAIFSYEAEVAE